MIARLTLLFACLALLSAADSTSAQPIAPAPQGIAVGEPNPSLPAPDPALVRYLGITGNGAGRWSSDGSRIAFSTSWTGTSQKWMIPADGGFPQRITFFTDTVDFCDYSPHDPHLMWLGVASGGNERTQLYFVNDDGTGLRDLAVDPAVIHNPGDWSRDGRYLSYTSNARDARYFDVYVYDTQTGLSRMVFQQDANVSAGKFSPDGKYLLASVNLSNVNNDVYLIATDGSSKLLLTTHSGETEYSSFCWADNATLYYASNQDREFAALARMELPLAKVEQLNAQGAGIQAIGPPMLGVLYAPQHDIESLNVSDDGRYIGWVENVDGFGEAHLATLPDFHAASDYGLKPGADKLPIPAGIQAVGRFSPDSRYVILQANGPEGTTDLWRYELATGAVLRLTYASSGGIPPDSFVQPQAVHYSSFDGLDISALWYEPKGQRPTGGWPVIVMAHGGPEGQSRPYFDPQVQLYLSLGIGVLEPNPRGSSGYGKTFMTLDNAGKRQDSVADYAAARDWLVAQELADPKRIAITGGSYGGYVVLAALTLYPDKWAAGVDEVGIANFVTFLENTSPYRRGLREAEYGSLDTDRAMLESISPIHRVDQVTAPLLIIHGVNDPRVPVGEAQQMHDALAALGREVDLLVFTDEGHGVAKLENRAIAWQRQLEFLKKHLGL